jgi:hypothetical protein
MSHRINSDSNDLNGEHLEANLNKNNSYDEKSEANKLERKNNESTRDWSDKGILWNLHPLQN